MALTDRQRRFVEEYLVDLNATQAAIRAGYSEKNALRYGTRLLTNPEVAQAVRVAQDMRSIRTGITQDMVLQLWWEIATADPNDLIQLRRTCCRYCHGVRHRYQWTEREYEHARRVGPSKGLKSGAGGQEAAPDASGGFGYDHTREPDPDCPECRGEGIENVYAHDTRTLTGAARRLLAGVKVLKDGVEIKMQDQAKALDNVARHLGMFRDKVELTGRDGAPLQVAFNTVYETKNEH